MVKNANYYSRVAGIDFQHPHGGHNHLSLQGDPTASFGLDRNWYTDTHAGKTIIHTRLIDQLIKNLVGEENDFKRNVPKETTTVISFQLKGKIMYPLIFSFQSKTFVFMSI